jgi:hypothetical protein
MKSKSAAKDGKRKKLADLPAGKSQAARVKGGFDPQNGVKITAVSATGSALPFDPTNGVRLR